MELASGTLASAKRGAVAHWKVSVTGERHGQGAGPRVVVGRAGRRRYRRTCGACDGRRRRAVCAESAGPDHRFGTRRGLETRLVPERGYQLELITRCHCRVSPAETWPGCRGESGVPSGRRGCARRVDADVVVGFGGYVALPAYLAARGIGSRRRIPVLIHEANASAGWPTESVPAPRTGSSPRCRTPGCGAPRWSAYRSGRPSPRWTARRCGPKRGHTSVSRRTRGCCWFRRFAGCGRTQPCRLGCGGRFGRRRRGRTARPRTQERARAAHTRAG